MAVATKKVWMESGTDGYNNNTQDAAKTVDTPYKRRGVWWVQIKYFGTGVTHHIRLRDFTPVE